MPRSSRFIRGSAVAATLALGLALTALAGPLDPPAGPVAPTHKTLTEVEPRIAVNATNTPGDANSLFRITQPGSYYLTGNITGVVGKHGIAIVASGVTLDLNGFDLVGVPAMGAFDGVTAAMDSLESIAVVNGSVRNWGGVGVDLAFNPPPSGCRVAHVLASGNAGNGIAIGTGSTITNCVVSGNGQGLLTGVGVTVTNCTAHGNTGYGIRANPGSTITSCSVYANGGTGIDMPFGDGGTVSNCTVYDNNGNGINADDGTTILDCAVRANFLDGIQCADDCLIRGNTCTNNGLGGSGAGIHATGGGNRIEGNICSNADRGIDVDAAGNIIVRNTCSNNTTNWVIAANNVYGSIIDRSAIATAAVNGNSASDTTATTQPNANFTY